MFDIAWSEMVLIGAVALVVIGPKDLPKALRTVGQTVARVRRMASEFQGQFNEAMREAELADLKKQVEDVGGSVSNSLNTDFKPIDSIKDFEASKTETPKPDEAALKEAEAKLAALPQPEPLPPVQIETPKPADKPKRERKTAAEPAAPIVEAPVAPVALADPVPEKPARKRSAKAAEAPVAVEAPVVTAPAKAPKAAAARKPKAVVAAAAPIEPAKPAARKRKTAKGEENSA
ncbi:Sec-independent protein translocase protein TatB [Bosea sp. UC22_33]|uniref:Sec-independent protein translocase protein TatB n=1 Tax=Bosea sp. UC22_33 TaxID=3350165 RepID=UPI003671A756